VSSGAGESAAADGGADASGVSSEQPLSSIRTQAGSSRTAQIDCGTNPA